MHTIVGEILGGRAANSSKNGHNFQTVAAISLVLDYLDTFLKVKNEHSTEDIVIQLSDESWILAQSKSSLDNEESPDARGYFKKGLKTLAEGHKAISRSKIIYITNIRKMLGVNTYDDDFLSGETIWYSDLDDNNKNLIKKIIPEDFDCDEFGIQ